MRAGPVSPSAFDSMYMIRAFIAVKVATPGRTHLPISSVRTGARRPRGILLSMQRNGEGDGDVPARRAREHFDRLGELKWDRLEQDVRSQVSLELHRRFLRR